MPMHRSNKAPRVGDKYATEEWFRAKKAKERTKTKATKRAKRKQRGR